MDTVTELERDIEDFIVVASKHNVAMTLALYAIGELEFMPYDGEDMVKRFHPLPTANKTPVVHTVIIPDEKRRKRKRPRSRST